MTDENLTSALAKVQAKLPHIQKTKTANVRSDKGSYSYQYADLSDIAAAIHPLLAAEGLAFTALPTITEGGFGLAYSLRHVSGESLDGFYPLPDPTRSRPQEIGSAITYGRRYVLASVTGVVPDEDDDGQAAQTAEKPKRAERIRKPAQPVVDEWTAPEGVTPPTPPSTAKTDADWFTGWQEKVSACTELPGLAVLYDEAKEARRVGKLTKADFEDAVVLKDVQKAAIERASAEWPEVAKPGAA